jgi:hypothetical protein
MSWDLKLPYYRTSDTTYVARMADEQAAKNARADRTPPEATWQTLKNNPLVWIAGAVLAFMLLRKAGR